MEKRTPKIGELFALRTGGETIRGPVTAAVDGIGFMLCDVVYLESGRGSEWIPVRKAPLENK